MSLTASGTTFADLQNNSGSLAYVAERVLAANPAVAGWTVPIIRNALQGDPQALGHVWFDLSVLLASYLRGEPMDPAAAAQRAADLAGIFAVLSLACNEAATLIAANPGAIVLANQGVSGLVTPRRVFS